MKEIVPNIDKLIFLVRGHKVMFDEDLARLYGVETRVMNQAIRRNIDRFPSDFMFQLSLSEFANLKSQIVTSSWGGRRKKPFVFTEHGAVMLASVLRSKSAIQMSIDIVRAFVRLRRIITTKNDINKQIAEIRNFILKLSNKTNVEFKRVWTAIENLRYVEDINPKEAIGFKLDD